MVSFGRNPFIPPISGLVFKSMELVDLKTFGYTFKIFVGIILETTMLHPSYTNITIIILNSECNFIYPMSKFIFALRMSGIHSQKRFFSSFSSFFITLHYF